MKKNILTIGFVFFCSFVLQAQARDYRVVFDLTSKDTMDHKAVIRWLNEIWTSAPDAKLEVVLYGQGLDMVLKDKSTVANEVTKFAATNNISFKVCEIAMKNHNIDKSELLQGVQTVPDGIYEIISKQRDGWGYIKAIR